MYVHLFHSAIHVTVWLLSNKHFDIKRVGPYYWTRLCEAGLLYMITFQLYLLFVTNWPWDCTATDQVLATALISIELYSQCTVNSAAAACLCSTLCFVSGCSHQHCLNQCCLWTSWQCRAGHCLFSCLSLLISVSMSHFPLLISSLAPSHDVNFCFIFLLSLPSLSTPPHYFPFPGFSFHFLPYFTPPSMASPY